MEEKIRILMLEDLEEDAGLIDRILEKENIPFIRERVDTRENFIDLLDSFKPMVVLSDHSLPQFNSIEALEIIQSKGVHLPFILVTGAVSEEFAVNCLKRGADDYILKSNLSRLPSAIQHALKRHAHENERRTQDGVLKKKNEELVKANSELDSFVYSVSHNLRAPISSILGVLNLTGLDKEESSSKIDYYLDLIKQSALRLDDIIGEILKYSQNARTEVAYSEIHVEQLIRECIKHLNYLEGYNSIEVDVKVFNGVIFFSDSYRGSVVLTNIIANALTFRDKSKPKHIVRIVATLTADMARIIVTDNGVGISPALLPKVFDMFYRANEKSQGAGLGLYIAKEVMAKIGGSIVITSTQYEGTNVTVTMPNKAPPTKTR